MNSESQGKGLKPLETRFQPTYTTGDAIQISGIYRVSHERHHSLTLDVVCVKSGVFPKCKHCKPTFTLVHRYSELKDVFTDR